MCRWITLISHETVSLSDIVLAPSNSLIQLARDASFHPGYGFINNAITNGDGFGVGWYHTHTPYYKPSTANVAHDGGLPMTTPKKENDADEKKESDSVMKATAVTAVASNTTTAVVVQPQAAMFKDIMPAWNNTNLRGTYKRRRRM
jgi:predicted glutamine amidotransferase